MPPVPTSSTSSYRSANFSPTTTRTVPAFCVRLRLLRFPDLEAVAVAIVAQALPEVLDDLVDVLPPDSACERERACSEHLRPTAGLVVRHSRVVVGPEEVRDRRDDRRRPRRARSDFVRLDASI